MKIRKNQIEKLQEVMQIIKKQPNKGFKLADIQKQIPITPLVFKTITNFLMEHKYIERIKARHPTYKWIK